MDLGVFVGGFLGACVGGLIGLIVIMGLILYFDRRNKVVEHNSPDRILERYIKQHIVDNFETLFPGWKIYDKTIDDATLDEVHTPLGVEFHVKHGARRGYIDILCTDHRNTLVVIELKKDRASDKVAAQIDRYINYVEKNVATPNQRVRGVIIAPDFDGQLRDSIERRRNISLWTYDWKLKLTKRPNSE